LRIPLKLQAGLVGQGGLSIVPWGLHQQDAGVDV